MDEQRLRHEIAVHEQRIKELHREENAVHTQLCSLKEQLAALLAPFPIGTRIEETYTHGYGRSKQVRTRQWQITHWGMSGSWLSAYTVLVKKDGSHGETTKKIDPDRLTDPERYAHYRDSQYRVLSLTEET